MTALRSSFPNDHVTIIALVFDDDTDQEIIAEAVQYTVETARKLLDCATKTAGCGLNAKKSEVLMPKVWWSDSGKEFKEEIIWLGFSFGISDDLYIHFTETKIRGRFIQTKTLLTDMFQYIDCVWTRWKLYKIYACPVMEWFIPTYITKKGMKITENANANTIEKFQQECLALVLKVPRTVPRNELNRIMGEKPILEKCAVTANRLCNYCPRNIQLLKWKNGVIPTSRTTRGQQNIRPGWTGADKNDIGDRMHVLAEEFRGIQNQVQAHELDVAKAKKWGKEKCQIIANHIKLQAAIKAAKEAVTASANLNITNHNIAQD